MQTSDTGQAQSRRRPYVMAVVLGTALTALGSAPASAAAPETTLRAVNDLSRYCTTCWRNARLHPDVWTDCTQEVLSRLLERVDPDSLGASAQGRRRGAARVPAGHRRRQEADPAQPSSWRRSRPKGVADRRDLHRRELADEREAVARAAAELLSDRQQRILQLSFDGWSVHEIAAELRTPPERVSDEKYKAIRKLRGRLCEMS